jgi:hypothetical protein
MANGVRTTPAGNLSGRSTPGADPVEPPRRSRVDSAGSGASGPPGDPLPFVWFAALIIVIALLSAAKTGFRFGESDDRLQAPLVIHRIDPTIFAGDPLIELVAPRYRSLLFDALAADIRSSGRPNEALLPDAVTRTYLLTFLLIRLSLIPALIHFARSFGLTRTESLLAAFTLGGLGNSLGGASLLESQLAPRVAALPIALVTLGLIVRARREARELRLTGRPIGDPRPATQGGWLAGIGGWPAIGRWILAALLTGLGVAVHPVTGLAVFGLGVTMLAGTMMIRGAPRRSMTVGVILLTLVALPTALWMGRGTTGGPLLLDPEWRGVIEPTVGMFVFITRDAAWTLRDMVGTLLLVGLFAGTLRWSRVISGPGESTVSRIRTGMTESAAGRARLDAQGLALLLAGAGLACLGHLVLVDGIGLLPALHACPQRATLIVPLAGHLLAGVWIADRWRTGSALSRPAVLLVLAALGGPWEAWTRESALALVILTELARMVPPPWVRRGLLGALPVMLAAGLTIGLTASGRALVGRLVQRLEDGTLAARVLEWFGPGRWWRQAATLTLDRNAAATSDQAAAEAWLAEHSPRNARILALPGSIRRATSLRPQVWCDGLATYTHLDRDFALRFADWRATVQSGLERRPLMERLAIARRFGASHLVETEPASEAPTVEVSGVVLARQYGSIRIFRVSPE